MAEREHYSIGEVLGLLQEEFPDVTISKIRFLETQGLLEPERSASGYRKFYDADVERLRWVLTQQKEHFLPLKVIREKLEEAQAPDFLAIADGEVASPVDEEPTDEERASVAARRRPRVFEAPDTDVSLTEDELLASSGLEPADLAELERLGMVVWETVGPDRVFDADALTVARTAAAFKAHGVQPRHLRMYKIAAEREAGFYEQVLVPVRKQRDAGARERAVEVVEELAGLGERMRAAMLRRSLRHHLGR